MFLPSFTSWVTHHPDFTQKSRQKEVDFGFWLWPHHFLVQKLPFCASQTGFSALLGSEQWQFEAAARTVDKWLEEMKRGVPHIREGRYMGIRSQSFLCPGCVCVSASNWVPDTVSEPFLTQPFTKYCVVCLLCFYEHLQIKWWMQLYFILFFGGWGCHVFLWMKMRGGTHLLRPCPFQHGVRVHLPCAPLFLRNSGGCVRTPRLSPRK